MIANPRPGSRVLLWYKQRDWWPHHGKIGMVRIAGRGKPRNHGIEVDGQMVVVPCGNLRKVMS